MQGFTDIFGTFPHATEMKKKYNCKQTAAEKHSVENTTVYSHTFIQKFRESNILLKVIELISCTKVISLFIFAR